MRRGYKVVCNTAAGRHRYMSLLVPYVLANDVVDRYDIWVNTLNPVDLRFFELLAQKYPKINLIYIDDNKFNGLKSLFGFYKYWSLFNAECWKNKIEGIFVIGYDMGKFLVLCDICLSTFRLVSREGKR